MSRRSERDVNHVDYALLAEGLPQEEHGDTIDDEARSSHETEPTPEPEPESEVDTQQAEVTNEIAILKAERTKLQQQKKLRDSIRMRDALKRECSMLKVNVAAEPSAAQYSQQNESALPFPPNTSLPPSCAPSCAPSYTTSLTTAQTENPTVRELRAITRLSEDAEAQLTRYGLDYAGSETRNNDNTGKHPDMIQNNLQLSQSNARYIEPIRNITSGKEIRMKDTVVKQLTWPQANLDFSYSASNIAYNTLDPALLVAGELSIFLLVSEEERIARTKLLRRCMYFSKDYTWNATRSFHETVLMEVERGTRQWQDKDYRDIETAVLYRHPITQQVSFNNNNKTNFQPKQQPARKFFCLDYNRATCPHEGLHQATVGTTIQNVEHFCSACWRRGRSIRGHPESSTECPNRRTT